MRHSRFLFLAAGLAAIAIARPARAADPVTIELTETVAVGKSIVAIGDVARVTGGDPVTRDRVARMDLAELKSRDPNVVVGRRAVEYRLRLAGFEPSAVRVAGADFVTVTASRRAVTSDEVTAVVRNELIRQIPGSTEPVVVELAVPIVVKLPEVPANERVVIGAKLHGTAGPTGRVQMDTTIAVGGETLLSFPVHMNVRPSAAPAAGARPGSPVPPAAAPMNSNEIVIRPFQRVEMHANSGGLRVTAAGESQQAGKMGQTILVQNVDSKKTISARVTGPGTVEVELGGAP